MNSKTKNDQDAADQGNSAAPDYIYVYYIDRRKSAAEEQKMGSTVHPPHAPVLVFLVKHDPNEPLDQKKAERLITSIETGELPILGYQMSDLALRHRAYMLFVWREAGVTLEDVEFELVEDKNKKNHSFMHPKKLTKKGDTSFFYRTNVRKNKYDQDLNDKDIERFDVNFVLDSLPFTDNETTTNIGP